MSRSTSPIINELLSAIKNADVERFTHLLEAKLIKKGDVFPVEDLENILPFLQTLKDERNYEKTIQTLEILKLIYEFSFDNIGSDIEGFFPLHELDMVFLGELRDYTDYLSSSVIAEAAKYENLTFLLKDFIGTEPHYKKIVSDRKYPEARKNFIGHVRSIVQIPKEILDSELDVKNTKDPRNIIWEAIKRLYGTGDRASHITEEYTKPIMKLATILVKRGFLNIIYLPVDSTREVTLNKDGKDVFGDATPIKKRVFITGIDTNLVATTLIHELTHFIDFTLDNFSERHDGDTRLFTAINSLERKFRSNPLSIHKKLRPIFEGEYEAHQYNEELLARIPEVLLSKKELGLEILATQAPGALEFYSLFLDEVCAQINRDEKYLTEDCSEDTSRLGDDSSVDFSDDEDGSKGHIVISDEDVENYADGDSDGYVSDTDYPAPVFVERRFEATAAATADSRGDLTSGLDSDLDSGYVSDNSYDLPSTALRAATGTSEEDGHSHDKEKPLDPKVETSHIKGAGAGEGVFAEPLNSDITNGNTVRR